MEKLKVYVDGSEVSEKGGCIPLLDYGFLFGHSIYEVLKTVEGRIFAGDLHLRRLRYSAEKTGIPLPWSNQILMGEMLDLSQSLDVGDTYIRLVITRGSGPFFFKPERCKHPRRIMYATKLIRLPDDTYQNGVGLGISPFRKGPICHSEGSVKTGNYLDHVLPRQKAISRGYHDALMLNHREEITECTSANIFWFCGDTLCTPSLDTGVLNGVTRQLVILAARKEGIILREGQFRLEEVYAANEVFITSTTRDILPVNSIENKDFTPGPRTRRLMAVFREAGLDLPPHSFRENDSSTPDKCSLSAPTQEEST
jgi:branched-chain amino acid aminotransferase